MRNGIQKLVIGSIALTALLVAAAPARAEDALIVTVPFDFVAGSMQFTAGKYEVRTLENPGVMSIRSADGRAGGRDTGLWRCAQGRSLTEDKV